MSARASYQPLDVRGDADEWPIMISGLGRVSYGLSLADAIILFASLERAIQAAQAEGIAGDGATGEAPPRVPVPGLTPADALRLRRGLANLANVTACPRDLFEVLLLLARGMDGGL